MKCSVCAQDIPEPMYAEHLASAHGVTDDPTAVLLEHLAGEREDGADDADDVDIDEAEDADTDDADVEDADAEEDDLDEESDEVDVEEDETVEAWWPADEIEAGAEDDDLGTWDRELEDVDEGEELADEEREPPVDVDQIPEAYPAWDVRGGARDVGTVILPGDETPARPGRRLSRAERRARKEAQVAAARQEAEAASADEAARVAALEAALAASASAAVDRDADEQTREDMAATSVMTVPAAVGVEEEVVEEPAPGAAAADAGARQRRWALLGLAAVVALIAAALIYIFVRDDTETTKTAATTRPTPATTVAPTTTPTVAAGEPGGAPTTVATTATPTTVAAAAPATPPPTPAPSGDPASRIAFSYSGAQCTPSGELSVFGSIVNNNPQAYSFSYTITVLRGDGASQGTANGSVTALPPGARNGPGVIGTGTCSYPLAQGPAPRQQITSITPA